MQGEGPRPPARRHDGGGTSSRMRSLVCLFLSAAFCPGFNDGVAGVRGMDAEPQAPAGGRMPPAGAGRMPADAGPTASVPRAGRPGRAQRRGRPAAADRMRGKAGQAG